MQNGEKEHIFFFELWNVLKLAFNESEMNDVLFWKSEIFPIIEKKKEKKNIIVH